MAIAFDAASGMTRKPTLKEVSNSQSRDTASGIRMNFGAHRDWDPRNAGAKLTKHPAFAECFACVERPVD